ncbi:PilZ domain-containing protein [Thermoproteota archaeon]
MPRDKIPREERRKYRRLDSVFPVEFQILNKDQHPISKWYQAFSQDISKGGICLTVNNLSPEESEDLNREGVGLLLQIHPPLSGKEFLAYANVAWIKKLGELPLAQHVIGIRFTKVAAGHIGNLFFRIRLKSITWRILQCLVIGMLFYLGFVAVDNYRLKNQNVTIMKKYSELLKKDLRLSQKQQELAQEKEALGLKLNKSSAAVISLVGDMQRMKEIKDKEIVALEEKILHLKIKDSENEKGVAYQQELKRSLEDLKSQKDKKIKDFEEEIVSIKDTSRALEIDLERVESRELEVNKEVSLDIEEKAAYGSQLKKGFYDWIKRHQKQKTGLVVSFEGDRDLKDTSFTYDQSLAVISFVLFGDYDDAKRGLDFFVKDAKRTQRGGFYNAYSSDSGDVLEHIAHAGPNAWLGIALLRYADKTKDQRYIAKAEEIADWIISLQDKEGGIVGGEGISWYSTEHNLSSFVFFQMLYESTKDTRYKDVSDSILRWLTRYAYGNNSLPVKRGKGDSAIATDTYAWSIAALGPKLLKKLDMDPDAIIKFAIENCLVSNNIRNTLGEELSVTGFDFARHEHMARGGVISCEWTAQMILAFSVMSEYYRNEVDSTKSIYYQNLVTQYLYELSKMVIISPSAFGQGTWCLPYASQENVGTGHGWRTPKGDRTGSVASTAYAIFAISGFNPLSLNE